MAGAVGRHWKLNEAAQARAHRAPDRRLLRGVHAWGAVAWPDAIPGLRRVEPEQA